MASWPEPDPVLALYGKNQDGCPEYGAAAKTELLHMPSYHGLLLDSEKAKALVFRQGLASLKNFTFQPYKLPCQGSDFRACAGNLSCR